MGCQAEQYNSSDLLNHPDQLRKRAEEDGFLFFRGLLPLEPIMELRKEALLQIEKEGLLAPGHELMSGIADMEACQKFSSDSTNLSRKAYAEIQSLPSFHHFAHHPKLISVYHALFQEEVLVHPRNIMRMVVPAKNIYPTDPHQDVLYIAGTENTWTSWIPLGDCPREIGNLSILKGSHKLGVLPVHRGKGAGGFECEFDDSGLDWVEFDFEAGDFVTFPSLTVHKSIPTQRPERVRLSLDYRFQPLSQPVHFSSLQPHMGALDWEEIYSNWGDQPLKYYWKKDDLKVTKETSFEKYSQLSP